MTNELELFLHLQDCNIHLDYSRYDADLVTILETNSSEKELNSSLFETCVDKSSVLSAYDRKHPVPIVYFGKLSVGWIFLPHSEEENIWSFHVLGPCFSSVLSEMYIHRQAELLSTDLPMQHRIRQYLPRIPVCSIHSLQVVARQFHYCFYREILSHDNYLTISSASTNDLAAVNLPDPTFIPHSPYQIEQQIFEAVENGETISSAVQSNINLSGYSIMPTTGDPLRDSKNAAYTSNVLACRAAIRGGVPPLNAYAISDMYIQLIEQQTSSNDAMALSQRILGDYTRVVREYRESSRSALVKETIAYIRTRIYEKISLENIAAELGYNKNYLAGAFKRETGKTIGEYIMDCKIRHAKTLLKTRRLSCAEISHQLCFSSESHFSQVFKRVTGMTPMEYVNSHW